MRAAFGILSLLICVAIIALWFSRSAPQTIETGKKAQEDTQVLSGRGTDGQSALKSVELEPKYEGGQVKSLQVTNVTPGGAMEQHYGLKPGDQIIQIGGVSVDMLGGAADAMVLDAYEKSQPLVVRRDGKEVTLNATGPGVGVPGAGSVQGQLDSIKKQGQ